MILTQENYFSVEADKEYMSVSQYKNFKKCEAKAMFDLEQPSQETKDAFLEGELFEALVAGDADLFYMQHPEIIASRGTTKGELKANFKKVLNSAQRFNQQTFIKDIIRRSEKQVILTGVIGGVKVKGKLDLLDLENKLIPDIKCMANFNDEWDKKDKCYKPWYYTYDYVLQLAIYQELVRQNYGIVCDTCLLAATKEETPDVAALKFDNQLLEIELKEFINNVERYDRIKRDLVVPNACGTCDFCKANKKILRFDEIK